MSLNDTLATILYRALQEEEIGLAVVVKPEDKMVILNTFYEVRQQLGDPELQKLIILQPGPRPNELWVCKKTVEL